jgi:hypothetical protein
MKSWQGEIRAGFYCVAFVLHFVLHFAFRVALFEQNKRSSGINRKRETPVKSRIS